MRGRKLPEDKKGANHPSWKGGSYIDAHGYRMVHIGGERETVNWNHYRKEHIVVMEQSIGRELAKDEVVHHVDGNKLNNELDNLWLTDHKGHRTAHQSLQRIGYTLIRMGLVVFDKDSGQYMAHAKWGELLEQLEEADQQPSRGGNFPEGSETRSRDPQGR